MFEFEEKFEGKKVESLNNFYESLKETSCTVVAENLSNYLFFFYTRRGY